jgi:hypothetical protein
VTFKKTKKIKLCFLALGYCIIYIRLIKKCAYGKYFGKKIINLINFFISIVIIEKLYVALIAERKKGTNPSPEP